MIFTAGEIDGNDFIVPVPAGQTGGQATALGHKRTDYYIPGRALRALA